MTQPATLFDIQRFSIHDGPGIRTTVFFKGCSLRCKWCQNPESHSFRRELAFYRERCVACGGCESLCPKNAIDYEREERIAWKDCNHCGACAVGCPSKALEMVGKRNNVDKVVEACLRDQEFATATGGGVTLSGGEAVLQSEFLQALVPKLKAENIHLLLQTAGNYQWSLLEPLLGFLDEIYFDWKAPVQTYKEHTGAEPTLVLENLKRLLQMGFPTTLRMVVVPNVTSEPKQIASISKTLRELGCTTLHLVRYNHLWESKLPRLNTNQTILNLQAKDVDLNEVSACFAANGVNAICPLEANPQAA